MLLGGRPDDRLARTIDTLLDSAGQGARSGARRVQIAVRERDPLRRLGLDVITGALQEISHTRAYEALATLPAVARSEWWLVPGVRLADAGQILVLAAAGHVVCIRTASPWSSGPHAASTAARSVRGLLEGGADVTPLEFDDPRACSRQPGSRRVRVVDTVVRLREFVDGLLDGAGSFDPIAEPALARALTHARRCAHQRDRAVTTMLGELDRRWLIAVGVPLPAVSRPVGILVAGPGGVYTCEPAGNDPPRAAAAAVVAAERIAASRPAPDVHVTPVVLCDGGTHRHHLALQGGRMAWALAAEDAAAGFRTVHRPGIAGRRLERLRRPAPGWEYDVSLEDGCWAYRVRYDRARHDRPEGRTQAE